MGDPKRTIRLDDLILSATDGLLIGPDYRAIMQICDVLNNRMERVPLAVSVIKERLKHREKDVQLRTLELLDAITKNVPQSVHHVGTKDFLSVLKKIATNKKGDFMVRENALAYIQSCALTLGQRSGTHFKEVYDALCKQGISFPDPNNESPALFNGGSSGTPPPSATQQRSGGIKGVWDKFVRPSSPPASSAAQTGHEWSGDESRINRTTSAKPQQQKRGTNEEQLVLAFSTNGVQGLQQQLSVLQNNIDLLEEILRNAQSANDLQGNEILDQLLSTCTSAQPQVQSLLAMPCPPMTEDMVAALLRTNDLLIGVQSLHQSVLQGKGAARQGVPFNGESSGEEETETSSDEEDDGTLKRDRKPGPSLTQHPQSQREVEEGDPVPRLLRAPPKARTPVHSRHPPSFPSSMESFSSLVPASPSDSAPHASRDILDEFAALTLRHGSTTASTAPPAYPFLPTPQATSTSSSDSRSLLSPSTIGIGGTGASGGGFHPSSSPTGRAGGDTSNLFLPMGFSSNTPSSTISQGAGVPPGPMTTQGMFYPQMTPNPFVSYPPQYLPTAAAFNPSTAVAFNPGTAAAFNPGTAAAFNPGTAAAFNPGTAAAFNPSTAAAFNPSTAMWSGAAFNPSTAMWSGAAFNPSTAAAFNPSTAAAFNPGTAMWSGAALPQSSLPPYWGNPAQAQQSQPLITAQTRSTSIQDDFNLLFGQRQ